MSVATSTAILIAAGVGAAGAVGGGIISANAAKSAASTEANAGQKAADLAQTAGTTANNQLAGTLSQEQQLLNPYAAQSTSGLAALTQALAPGGSLSQQFSYNPSDVSKDPAYQFQLQQGLQSVQRAQAASGTLNSGGAAKALTQYAGGVAASYENQDYNQALSTYGTNRNATLSNLSLPIQLGEYGTSGLTSALQNYGNQFSSNTINTANTVGSDLTGKANAQAAGTVGAANAYTGALGGLANTAQLATLFSALGGSGTGLNGPYNPNSPTGLNGLGSTLPTSGTYDPDITAPQFPVYQTAPTAFNTGYVANTYGAPSSPGGYLANTYGAPQ